MNFQKQPFAGIFQNEYRVYMLLEDCYNCFLLFETYQLYYAILLIAFEFVFILEHIFCLPQ